MTLSTMTNSKASAFRRCPRFHHYAYNMLQRPIDKSGALRFGQLWHDLLYHYHRTGRVMDIIMPDSEEDKQDLLVALSLLAGYATRYGKESWKVLYLEHQFRGPLVNPSTGGVSRTFELASKVDGVVVDNGKYFLLEHKTTSSDIEPGSTYWQRLRLDSQVSIYHDLVEKNCGVELAGTIYNVVRKPTIRRLLATPEASRKYTKDGRLYANQRDKDETLEEYIVRFQEDITANPDKYYQRQVIIRTEMELEESRFDVWATAKMVRECEVVNRHPRNSNACFNWNRQCDYFDVCCGVESIFDGTRFRTANTEHEELVSE